ncbi:MAG: alpha-amylase [Deltaproteobacteria bacterium]|nr:alpha-amylase [Deltaproteobacteria bacterium]
MIYSLFPRLAGTMPQWLEHSARAAEMGFNWIHLNPLHYPGFSGSLYAVKDFYRLNPLFVPKGCEDPMEELRRTIDAMHEQGLLVMMDLVVNHTAKDSPLIKDHPSWFRRDENGYVISPSAIDPADTRNVTVWGDLAEVDNAHSTQHQELWAYWTALVQYYLDLGFDGFRCDAAYKVPTKLWRLLIAAGSKRKEGVHFFAETLGCRLAEVRGLKAAGFDYLFNSSKWWNFDQMWALDQHAEFAEIAPSVSFPETHDTTRLFADTDGTRAVQKQRYVLATAFSAGNLMPIGYEYCFTKKLHVVESMPEDWEGKTRSIVDFIKRVNGLVPTIGALSEEGRWRVLTDLGGATTLLCKEAEGVAPLVLAVNKDWHSRQRLKLRGLDALFEGSSQPAVLRLYGKQTVREALPKNRELKLAPAEIALVTPDGLE